MSNRIVILGAGESGTGAALLAKAKGFDVFVSDKGTIKEKYKKLLDKYQILWEENFHSSDKILNAAEIIKSPGIREDAEIVVSARDKKIPVISEIEFAARFTNAKKICITGSNGKTTTTHLLYHILQKANYNVAMVGNVGSSFAMKVFESLQKPYDYFVIELSSFQLDGMYRFKADIAILLNITPDHLDRYHYNIEEYIASKYRIIQNQTPSDYFIYCLDDKLTMDYFKKFNPQATCIGFSQNKQLTEGAFINNENQLILILTNTILTMSIQDLGLQGKHNVYNSMAAGIAAHVLKIRKEKIRESLMDFQGVEHRLEPVIKVHGIEFINDSKATNVNSTWYALECMQKPVIWIVGGVDKGNDYSELYELVKEKVKAIVCLGKDNSKIRKAFGGIVETIIETSSMQECVKKAYKLGKNGDVVLLSPCCASFDLFENYEDRGRQFKNAVREL